MAENSKIEWCHHTFNPWRGCTKISPGCTNCYADTMSKRNPLTLGVWGPKGTRVVAAESYWRQPLKWDKAAKAAGERHRVFCASLADVFEGPDTMRREDWEAVTVARSMLMCELIPSTPNLDWLILTKRPEHAVDWENGFIPRTWARQFPPNVWLGTSVEDQQRADERIPLLLQTPAAVRFLSVEPMLEPVDLRHIQHDGTVEIDALTGDHGVNRPLAGRSDSRIHWVIVGGESGPGARPCDVLAVQSIIDQCKEAGVSVFVKQLGSRPMLGDIGDPHGWPTDCGPVNWETGAIHLNDRKGGEMSEWPEDIRVREFPAGVAQ